MVALLVLGFAPWGQHYPVVAHDFHEVAEEANLSTYLYAVLPGWQVISGLEKLKLILPVHNTYGIRGINNQEGANAIVKHQPTWRSAFGHHREAIDISFRGADGNHPNIINLFEYLASWLPELTLTHLEYFLSVIGPTIGLQNQFLDYQRLGLSLCLYYLPDSFAAVSLLNDPTFTYFVMRLN